MFREMARKKQQLPQEEYIQGAAYIEDEIRTYGHEVLCFALVPGHISGKITKES